jgi:HD-GYP domain-containing protein (c-di-GMP phosphodiesterase class II)
MSASALPADERERLASFIHARRHALVDAIAASPALGRLPGAVVVAFAKKLLGRLCQEIRDENSSAVDRLTKLPADDAEASDLARIAAEAYIVVGKMFAAQWESSSEVESYLAARSRDLEKRFRNERTKDRQAADPSSVVASDDLIASLLSALEARDPASCDHSRAVGMWSGRLAKTLGMSDQQQAVAVLAGTLHDVGKIATPTELLLKPSALTTDEREVVRAHSAIGGKMLERLPSLRQLAPIVRAHHERVDGEGYPDQLTGAAIPMLARVVAVSDSFHAMISKRPYRQPIPVATALDELRGGAGTQYDAAVVAAMLSLVEPAVGEEPPQSLIRAAQ